jgi:hypothetical protein
MDGRSCVLSICLYVFAVEYASLAKQGASHSGMLHLTPALLALHPVRRSLSTSLSQAPAQPPSPLPASASFTRVVSFVFSASSQYPAHQRAGGEHFITFTI